MPTVLTSFGPNRISAQKEALKTWLEMGLYVVALQSDKELEDYANVQTFPQVQFIPNNDTVKDFNVPAQKISSFLQYIKKNGKALILNSDIEIHCERRRFYNYYSNDNPTACIRYNYVNTWDRSEREPWGIDGFILDKHHVCSIPDIGLGMGVPFWDYWLPYHLTHIGEEIINFVGEEMFFHMHHGENWSNKDWAKAAKLFLDYYGIEEPYWPEFRRQWPYGGCECLVYAKAEGLVV